MLRRNFLKWSAFLSLSSFLKAENFTKMEVRFKKVEQTILEVQQQMFPYGSKLPSAKEMKTTTFLFDTMMHSSFDRDIRSFIIRGAEKLEEREKGKFTTYSIAQKEKAMRSFESTRYGRNWLGRMMTMAMEAMFSDPIYGSNINEAGWKALNSFGGFPRPKTRYLENV